MSYLRKIRVVKGLSGRYSRKISQSSIKKDDHYIQKSKTPTMHFQASLPRLPIPKLAESCQRYLAAQRPILTQEEFAKTEQLTKEFSQEGSVGDELHKRLLEKDKKNKHTSFIAEFWYDMYLKDRRPLVLNHNPFLTFKDDPRNPSQTDRAAQLIWSAVRFYNTLRDGFLRPEVYHLNPSKSDKEWYNNYMRFVPSSLAWYASILFKAFPLDMSQYDRLFYSTRIPMLSKDNLITYPETSHIIVMRNDHMYILEVKRSGGTLVNINEIYAKLEAIKSDSTPPPTHPISFLSTLGRDEWAKARNELVSMGDNVKQLEILDSALFVISLDESEPSEPVGATRVFLHNYGYNRWFDKSFQLMVANNSGAAISFEHAWGDGVAVLRLFTEIYKETINKPCPLTQPISPAPLPPKLDFALSENLKAVIDGGRQDLKELVDSLSVNTLMDEKFNRGYLKSKNLSPDGFIQLAFQIAYYRQYKTSPSTYESCSTAAFRHGRTETIRPASVPSMKCAMSFEPNSGASDDDKIKLIQEAIKWHSKLVREAATGKGFDRHLMALRCLAESSSLSVPFFQDPGYAKLNNIIFSTSTLPGDDVLYGGFAPVNPDSYAIGYGVRDDMLGSNIVTYPTRDGALLIKNLNDVLNEMYCLLQNI